MRKADSLALCNTQMALKKAFKNFFENPNRFGHPDFYRWQHSFIY